MDFPYWKKHFFGYMREELELQLLVEVLPYHSKKHMAISEVAQNYGKGERGINVILPDVWE